MRSRQSATTCSRSSQTSSAFRTPQRRRRKRSGEPTQKSSYTIAKSAGCPMPSYTYHFSQMTPSGTTQISSAKTLCDCFPCVCQPILILNTLNRRFIRTYSSTRWRMRRRESCKQPLTKGITLWKMNWRRIKIWGSLMIVDSSGIRKKSWKRKRKSQRNSDSEFWLN